MLRLRLLGATGVHAWPPGLHGRASQRRFHQGVRRALDSASNWHPLGVRWLVGKKVTAWNGELGRYMSLRVLRCTAATVRVRIHRVYGAWASAQCICDGAVGAEYNMLAPLCICNGH